MAKKKASAKQIKWRKKFKKASQVCKKGKKGTYRNCMRKELKKVNIEDAFKK